MKHICLYFQLHQPFRLRKYSFFSIGGDDLYFDDVQNREIIQRVARNCYLPFNQLLLQLIISTGYQFRVSFSLSGTVISQLQVYAPEVLASFRALVDTGCVELLGETSAHSLAGIISEREFRRQVTAHKHLVRQLFGQMPQTFRNTELIYADQLAPVVHDLGFDTILAEGTSGILEWRSPNYMYAAESCPAVRLLLKNGRLSDDIAFRFSDSSWSGWPLTATTYLSWLNAISGDAPIINLFMDYESFGEHIPQSSGISGFMEAFISGAISAGYTFVTPQEAGALLPVSSTLSFPAYTSWADTEKDLSAWLGNDMQREAFHALYQLEDQVMKYGHQQDMLTCWNRLQSSDHFYYMSTKGMSDGDVHHYFSPYASPFNAFINYMNVLTDFSIRVRKKTAAGPSYVRPYV